MNPTATPIPEPPKTRHNALVALSVAVVTLLAIGGTVLAFNSMPDSIGDRMASAGAMPPDTAIYASVDFGSLGDLDRLLLAFEDALIDAGKEPGAEVVDLIDEMLRDELDIGVDDVKPWIARDAGIGLTNLDLLNEKAQAVAAISVRDAAAADEFLSRYLGQMAARLGTVFTETSYKGVQLFSSADFFEGPAVVARSGDMMLLATDVAVAQRAIDAQEGNSLSENPDFQAVTGALPEERAATLFMSLSVVGDLMDAVYTDPALAPFQADFAELETALDAYAGLGMSAALIDEGIRLDLVGVYDPEALPDIAADPSPFTGGPGTFADLLPTDTIMFVGVGEWDVAAAWQDMRDQLTGLEPLTGDLDEFLAGIEEELGFDLEQDLIAQLTGELGFGVVPSLLGPIAESGDVGLGMVAALGLTDPVAMAQTVDDFRARLDLGAPVAGSDGATWYTIADEGMNVLTYGVGGGRLLIGTSAEDLRELFADGPKLPSGDLYRRATAAVEGEPFFFLDVTGLLDAVNAEPAIKRDLQPLVGLVATAQPTENGVEVATVLALIDY